MSAVTVDVLTHTAHEAGLEGGTLQPLVNGACSFSSLTFKTTSYNLKGKPIHLMASLLVRERDRLCIVASRLSPPLLVDARKRQSKEDKSGRAAEAAASVPGQGHSLLPFAPALLERKLEKVDRESSRREIDDSLDGLRAYLSALNIRNKCKHPLFLVLRFNSCVGLWYDTALRGDPLADDASFCAMMRELSSLDGKGTPPNSGATGEPARLAPFVIAIKSLHGAGACHLNCPVQLPSSVSLPHASSLPSTYREVCDHQLTTLRRTYCRLYCSHASGSTPPDILGGNALLGPPCPLMTQASRPVLIGGPPCACGEFGSGDASAHTHQRHAAELLASARQMVLEYQATEVNGDADGGAEVVAADNECPEREWEAGLLLLAESLALHCATRSSAEIVAFMRHDEARAAKRHSGVTPGRDHAPGDAPANQAHPTAPALAGEGSLQPG